MNAILHYAWLKGMRDKSLPVFALIQAAQFAAMTIAVAAYQRQFRYPLPGLNFDSGDVAAMSILTPSFVATLSAFWTFRSEVGTKAINSFVVASRPIHVIAALVAFAAATATAGWLIAFGVLTLLTASVPMQFASAIGLAAIASLSGASIGALYVMLSPEPTMLVWSFVATVPLVPFIFDPRNWDVLPIAAGIIAVVAIPLSTVFLRRRCAT